MNEDIPKLTLASFESIPWQQAISETGAFECITYAREFYRRSKHCDEHKNIAGREAYLVLGHCAGLMLEASNPDEPFQPAMIFRTGRSSILDDVSKSDLDVLGELVPDTEDPEMQARLADILWVTIRDFRSAQIAVKAYLESSLRLDANGEWIDARDRLERALRLASQLGRGGRELHKELVDHIEAVLSQHDVLNRERTFQPAHLMRLLLEFDGGDAARWAELARTKAEQGEAGGNLGWEMAQDYWLLSAAWAKRLGDISTAHTAELRAAETFVSIAAEFLSRKSPDHLSASIHLQKAVEALRQLGESERAAELRHMLIKEQALAAEQMQSSTYSYDISASVQKMIDAIKNKSFLEATLVLVHSASSPTIESLQRLATNRSDNQLFIDLIATHERVDHRGRVTGRRPNRNANDPQEVQAAIEADMFDAALRLQEAIVASVIEPARYQISLEHRVRESDLLALLRYSPFVPPGREHIYAKGLRAGFVGDFIESSHLLVPQIEHSIRILLEQRGVLVHSLSSDGVQQDFDISRLLGLAETRQLLGENLSFDLQGLLVGRFGSNWRNRLAHGLVDQSEFYSTAGVYVWWIVLRLCMIPLIPSKPTQESVDESVD